MRNDNEIPFDNDTRSNEQKSYDFQCFYYGKEYVDYWLKEKQRDEQTRY